MSNLPTGIVTFLFTDIEGSTPLWEKHPEAMKSALAKHDSILKEAIESNHGHIIKTTGDGVHAVFQKAVDAVNAAVGAQRELQRMNASREGGRLNERAREENSSFIIYPSSLPLKVRMGIHTGEAELRDCDYYGQSLNRAARVMSAGHGWQILISDVTAQVAREHLAGDVSLQDMGEHHSKDCSDPNTFFKSTRRNLNITFRRCNRSQQRQIICRNNSHRSSGASANSMKRKRD